MDADEALIARVGRGDASAIRTLIAAKGPRITALGYRMLGDLAEAEDVAQETFLRVWRHASAWRPGPAKFDTWMHRVAMNLCYDRLRKRREAPMAEPPDQPDDGPAPDAGLLSGEIAVQVAAALANLPDRQREAIILTHYQELGGRDAADIMEISVEALESLLSRGRRALRAALADVRAG